MTELKAAADKVSLEAEVLIDMAEAAVSEPERVCFVCTGNTCRSPMAAAVLNHLGKPYGITACSGGIAPNIGEPVCANAVTALLDAGIEPSDGNRFDLHTARLIDEEMIMSSSRVVCMTESHMFALIGAFPQYISKFHVMPHPISDPFGGDIARYKGCLREITDGICEMFRFDN